MNKSSSSIGAVMFEIGGVLVRTEDSVGRRKWERRLGLPEWGVSALVFDGVPALRASMGQGPDEAIWHSVAQACHLSSDVLAQLRADFWSGDRLNQDMLAYLRSLRPQYRTGILSNAWPEMRDMNVQRFGLVNVVDEVIYSFQCGLLKPDPGSYRLILDRLGVEPRQTVFVDDAERNIIGARALGMITVQFSDTQQAITELRALLEQNT
jgi:epoxide hydrolase-like predicted phosphatase